MSNITDTEQAILDASIPESIRAGIEALAKGLGVAALELWSIFVRQYVVKGLTELFTGISLSILAWVLHGVIGWFALIPVAIAHLFFYGAILLLGNPKYYAISDISSKIKEIK